MIEHARFEQALQILETDKTLRSSSHQKVCAKLPLGDLEGQTNSYLATSAVDLFFASFRYLLAAL